MMAAQVALRRQQRQDEAMGISVPSNSSVDEDSGDCEAVKNGTSSRKISVQLASCRP